MGKRGPLLMGSRPDALESYVTPPQVRGVQDP